MLQLSYIPPQQSEATGQRRQPGLCCSSSAGPSASAASCLQHWPQSLGRPPGPQPEACCATWPAQEPPWLAPPARCERRCKYHECHDQGCCQKRWFDCVVMYQKVLGLQLLLDVRCTVRDAAGNAGVTVQSCPKKSGGCFAMKVRVDTAASSWGVT